MSAWRVIDTNVLAVANEAHERASYDCVGACISALSEARATGVLVDQGKEIFEQYRRNASHSGQPGVGDAFWKWLWDNQANEEVCIQVPLERDAESGEYRDFPAHDPDLAAFDRSDRVFVAVAIACAMDPQILNASDTDWWIVRGALERHHVRVQFLCPELMQS